MKAEVEKIEKNIVELEVEIDSDKVDQAINRAYKKLAKKYNIPGFRKGKVPRKILVNYIGKEPLYNEALDEVLPGAYLQAVEETKIEPIDKPEVDLVQMEEGKPLIFKAKVEVKPEVGLGEYKGLEVEQEEVEITDEQVDNHLETMRKNYAQMITVEEAAREGDMAIIDFEGFVDGEAFEGGKGENYSLGLGAGTFIPGFEEQLIGSSAGEEKDVLVTFPEDYQQETLAGKEALFKVKVHEIKRKELAPLDDEFAKDVSEFETLEELKADIRNRLKETAEESALKKTKDSLVEKAMENSQVDIPDIMVENRIDNMIDNLDGRLAQQGLSLGQYLEIVGQTEEDLRNSFKEDAAKNVKSQLVLEAIGKKEGIEAIDEEVDGEVKRIADAYQQSADAMKSLLAAQGNLESLKTGIMLDKTVDFLYDNAKVTTVKKSASSTAKMEEDPETAENSPENKEIEE